MAGKKSFFENVKVKGKVAGLLGVKYTGKLACKLLELGVVLGSTAIGALARNDQFQVIATTGGLIAASVAFPPVLLGTAAIVGGKFFADKVLGYRDKSVLQEMKDTILLGKKITSLACDKIVAPATQTIGKKAQELGKSAQQAIDSKFDGGR